MSAFLLSLQTAAAATVVALALGLAAALAMRGRRFRGQALVDALLLAPLMLPPTVVGFVLLLILGMASPFGRWYAEVVGSGFLFTWPAAVVAAAVIAFPIMYMTARAALEQVDADLLAAARTLGAKDGRVIVQVLLPLAKPGLIAATVLTFARALGEFGATLMIAGNIPGKTQTVPLAIYGAVETGQLGEAASWAGLMIAVAVGLLAGANVLRDRPPGLSTIRISRPERSSAVSGGGLDARVVRRLPNFTLDVGLETSGRVVALLGASGAGKSLLLRCLAGLERPDDGRILLGARDVTAAPAHARRVGLVFQHYALFPHMTVRANVAFGAASEEHVDRWLRELEIEPFASRLPAQLSGGQRQRVALARALASDPALLLLDEPLSALDAHLRVRLAHLLAATIRKEPRTTILVTHDIDEAFRIADDLVVLDQGRVVARGEKHAVLASPGTVAAARLTGCKNISRLEGRRAVDWGVDLPIDSRGATHVGARAYQIRLAATPSAGIDSFPGWLAACDETPHRATLYVKLGAPPQSAVHDLQIEILKERWDELRHVPQPWGVTLPPERLMLLDA